MRADEELALEPLAKVLGPNVEEASGLDSFFKLPLSTTEDQSEEVETGGLSHTFSHHFTKASLICVFHVHPRLTLPLLPPPPPLFNILATLLALVSSNYLSWYCR
jgi:hypothetical protein